MKETVKTKERQLRFLTLTYISTKRPATHNSVLFIDRKHIMKTRNTFQHKQDARNLLAHSLIFEYLSTKIML